MATLGIPDRIFLAKVAARRRAVRARVIAAAATLLVAWCARSAMAMPVEPCALQQATSERQPLGAAPAAPSASSGIGEAVRVAGALVVVVGIAFAAKWWLRRTGLAARVQGGTFEVIARQPVGRGQHVLVARFGPRLLCVQQTRDGLRTLSELTDPTEVAAALAQARGDAPAAGNERTVDLRRKDAAS
jgi:flagellar biogenesis protein FliO